MTAIYKRELKSYFQSNDRLCPDRLPCDLHGNLFYGVQLKFGISLFFICSDEYQLRVDHHYPDAYHAFLCGGTEEQDRPASACRTGKII